MKSLRRIDGYLSKVAFKTIAIFKKSERVNTPHLLPGTAAALIAMCFVIYARLLMMKNWYD